MRFSRGTFGGRALDLLGSGEVGVILQVPDLVVLEKLPDSVLGLHLRQSVSQLLIRIDPSQHGLLALHVLHQMQKLQG